MSNDAGAQQAINAMHEKEHDGRPLTVNEAKPRESQRRRWRRKSWRLRSSLVVDPIQLQSGRTGDIGLLPADFSFR